jgi:hypothetical protein
MTCGLQPRNRYKLPENFVPRSRWCSSVAVLFFLPVIIIVFFITRAHSHAYQNSLKRLRKVRVWETRSADRVRVGKRRFEQVMWKCSQQRSFSVYRTTYSAIRRWFLGHLQAFREGFTLNVGSLLVYFSSELKVTWSSCETLLILSKRSHDRKHCTGISWGKLYISIKTL